MKSIIMAALVLMLASCASTQKKIDSWIGSTKQEVIMQYGPPVLSTSDRNGGEILTFSKSGAGGYSTTMWNYTHYAHFYFGKDGLVYHVMVNGEKEVYTVNNVIPIIR
jgi:hypothetical protein